MLGISKPKGAGQNSLNSLPGTIGSNLDLPLPLPRLVSAPVHEGGRLFVTVDRHGRPLTAAGRQTVDP